MDYPSGCSVRSGSVMRFADVFGWYELNPFPGSNQIVVSNHAFIYPKYRGTGKGKTQHEQRLMKARELGYDLIVCTVNSNNLIEKHILDKYGWSKGAEFRSTETNHLLEMWSKEI